MTNPTTTRRQRRAYDLGERILLAASAGHTEDDLRAILRWQPMDLDETEQGTSLRLYGHQTGRHGSAYGAILAWARLATEQETVERRRDLIRNTAAFRAARPAAA
ncbi:hypothetical protein [Marinibacterium sp. SX1]|uniref:hypothetical protein n=1 Tax=Marinibacterium sp. SX1 TaxID=3388424 RepID=UPI003D171122